VPERPLIRVFLDSNILYSATHDVQSDFLAIWQFRDTTPIVSQYVLDEVSRNIRSSQQRQHFERLLEQTEIISDADMRIVPATVSLVAKDRPILAAAINARADYLVTGDMNHFGDLYDTSIANVRIMKPRPFLLLHKNRLKR
jgi:predicted nucleic acid-binding protein